MYRPAEPHEPRPTREVIEQIHDAPSPAVPFESAYGAAFWLTYLANTLLMVSVSLLFRYGDYVTVLGGTARTLGWIVGIGTVGSLLMRLLQGVGIDRYGPRLIWLASLAGIVLMLLAHLLIQRVDTPWIYLVRIAYHTCLAGAFGASITYISLRAPVVRMAEMIGMLGSSGFVGMALGTQLGDALCGGAHLERWHVDRLFMVAALLVSCSWLFSWFATRGTIRPAARSRPPLMALVRRYQPGPMLWLAAMVGVGVGLPGTFLVKYTSSLGITQIGTFFGVYSVTAFVTRLATRQVPDRLGIRPTVLLGMVFLILSMLLYLPVRATWQLAIPGFMAGIAHALLFPAVVAGGSGTFPARYRGLGVTLMLGMFDLGNLIGMPVAGEIVERARHFGLPGYATMFVSIAAFLAVASLYFSTRRIPARRTARGIHHAEMRAARPPKLATAECSDVQTCSK